MILADGTTILGSTVEGGGQRPQSLLNGVTFTKGIPTKLTWRFEGVPTTVTTLRGVVLAGFAVQNVRLVGTTPAPSATPAPVNVSSYNAELTNCKAGANGTLTCTATLTPRR
ncbi:hypothetical protein C8263_16915 [Deinococcus arcticus]|uniref:Uncharacterized protein n=1 Tax=Deinococcus arcticus TaxID=2136176 RepID=A0A2T3W496_9DEIO|nr:hypothetical protein C8263_16915 [Deinococcus arcticus]